MADRAGQQLGNYQLIRLLGRGGFAEVYLGQHIHLDTLAAVKVLLTQLASEDVENFRKEARTVAHLEHLHIVRVLEFGIEGTVPFLVMSYAPNGSLRQRYPKGSRLPLPTIISYIKQVADALQYAHDQNLIHRDVKPDNMLLGRQNEVLLSDFGITTIAHNTSSQSTQAMTGTVPYMAPEQVQGKSRPASDQYSLGIVVYEWLCGSRPFNGTATEIAMQHIHAPIPSLQEKEPAILPEVEQVVMMALAKDPKQRFASVQAFATALEQTGQTTPSRPVAPPTETTFPSEPSRPLLPAHMVTSPSQSLPPPEVATPSSQSFQLTDALTKKLSSQASSATAPLPIPVPLPDSPPSQSFQPAVATTPSNAPDISPSLTKESVPLDETQPSQRHISRRTVLVGLAGAVVVGSGGLTWLAISHELQVTSPTLSPTIPTLSSTTIPIGTTLYIYHQKATSHSGIPYVSAIGWSPDSRRIASGDGDTSVQIWGATDGGHIFIYHGHSNSVGALAWSPNGQRIASGGGDQTVQVWDAITGNRFSTYRFHHASVAAIAWSHDGKYIASGDGNSSELSGNNACKARACVVDSQHERRRDQAAIPATHGRTE